MGIFEEAIISGDDILNFIPQKPPIVMVDAFFGIQETTSKTGLTVAQENIFCANDILSEYGVIEHIAQSAAVRVGYLFKSKNEEVPLGYIGSINNFIAYRSAQVGETLSTTITIEHEVMGITLISAKVTVNNELIADCKMKIFIQP